MARYFEQAQKIGQDATIIDQLLMPDGLSAVSPNADRW